MEFGVVTVGVVQNGVGVVTVGFVDVGVVTVGVGVIADDMFLRLRKDFAVITLTLDMFGSSAVVPS